MDNKTNTRIQLPHDHGTLTSKILEVQPSDKNFEIIAEAFKLISDSSRLKIFFLLCHSEDCVINIAATVEMSSPAVSHHLRLMKQSGLIDSHKVGKEVYYKLADTEEAKLLHTAVDELLQIKCPNQD